VYQLPSSIQEALAGEGADPACKVDLWMVGSGSLAK